MSVHPSAEQPLVAFVSSRMDNDTKWARKAVAEALCSSSFVQPWLFENAPASSQPVVRGYLDRVHTSDLVIWLAERETTAAVRTEITTALKSGRRILVFRITPPPSDSSTESLIEKTNTRYVHVTESEELKRELLAALDDEIVRSWRSVGPPNQNALLDRLYSQSRSRCIDRWLAAGVPAPVAEDMADDPTIGGLSVPPFGSSRFVILRAEIGAGKSLAAERIFQSAIRSAQESERNAVPIFVEARNIGDSIDSHLGDQSFVHLLEDPTLLVIDGLDEADVSRRVDLAREARRMALAHPSLRVLVTSRPTPDLSTAFESSFIDVPPLSQEQSEALIARIAGYDVYLHGFPQSFVEAIRRPLFAILAGVTQSGQGLNSLPKGRLLSKLVELSLGRVNAHLESADPLLRKLARLTVDRGGAAVPIGEIGTYAEMTPLLRSRLVVERDGCLRFPLAILAEWFAARELEAGMPSTTDIAKDSERLSNWLVPLQMCVATTSPTIASRALRPLATERPAIAARVLDETFPGWEDPEGKHSLPSWEQCGLQLREAMAAWAEGLGPVARLVAPIGRTGQLRTIGVRRHDESTLTVSWARQNYTDQVVQLPPDHGRDPEWHGFTSRFKFGAHSGWAWQWAREYLRDGLGEVVRIRALPWVEALNAEAAWRTAVSLVARGDPWMTQPIRKHEVVDRCQQHLRRPPAPPYLRRIDLRRIEENVENLLRVEGDYIHPPWPGPEERRGPYLWSGYSNATILERTRAVYSAALEAYFEMVDRWFPRFKHDLSLAGKAPFRMIGVVTQSTGSGEWYGGLGLTYYLEKDSNCTESRVEFDLGDEGARRAFLRKSEEKFESGRIDSFSGSVLDVFDLDAAEKLAYEWLAQDLSGVGWA